ncbi:uncharacterized protein LOC122538450 [Frieseomelitta varia]|uniref:uncharacterized protein LOC122538450 n=1 Tax=Frieseomelitta varia TaxID=561572 RepID=UPI001CB6A206|nr:uncharacterized protein LOC122538450 [Frieseomelitta varia]
MIMTLFCNDTVIFNCPSFSRNSGSQPSIAIVRATPLEAATKNKSSAFIAIQASVDIKVAKERKDRQTSPAGRTGRREGRDEIEKNIEPAWKSAREPGNVLCGPEATTPRTRWYIIDQ